MARPKLLRVVIFVVILVIVTIPILIYLITKYEERNLIKINHLEANANNITKSMPAYQARIDLRIQKLKDPKLSEEEKYKSIQDLVFFFGVLYSSKNDPIYRKYIKTLGQYTKVNLPKFYNPDYFITVCQDKTCSDSNPNEIKKLLELISKSDFPEDLKYSYSTNIKNTNYIENKYKNERARSYYEIYVKLRTDKYISKSKSLKDIEAEFANIINSNYKSETKGLEQEYRKTNPFLKD